MGFGAGLKGDQPVERRAYYTGQRGKTVCREMFT